MLGSLVHPCRMCPHVVIVVGLESLVTFGAMQIKPLMSDRLKKKIPESTEVYTVRE